MIRRMVKDGASQSCRFGDRGTAAGLMVASLVLLLSACSSLRVSSDYDAGVDFSALRTYNWLPSAPIKSGDPDIQYDSLLEQRMKAAVEAELAAKGLVRSETDPDLLVTYHVAVDNKVSVTYLNDLYGYGPGWWPGYRRSRAYYGYGYGYGTTETIVSEYQQGTLIVDMVRASDKQLVWRGTASDEVYPDNSAGAREQRVREAVAKIFTLYPPADSGAVAP